ncbi:MFS transporter [Reichenbachiella agarivorans]|uniref:MFS transporter n=1 Tax=Reichenbachiella agarivorans TaxID=2979464 RepID=A0ABY6CRZ4_9BACT|nr:MFS transporter [Reichenbachiella agarivorans]UXP33291.1 MFS transporter [Reichenbachiella agarivorans]
MQFRFGLAGTSFAIGIVYSSLWFPKHKQGTVLGIFGAGNSGAAITTLVGPSILNYLTDDKTNLDNWRLLPQLYAAGFVLMALVFFLSTENKKPATSTKIIINLLSPLKSIRVWRFGLYYFLVFGCFVSFAGWLVPYYTNVYSFDLATAGILASCFSLPSGIVRAFGGWLSDKFGARMIMYRVLGGTLILSAALILPKMDVFATGEGVSAKKAGTVTVVSPDHIIVDDLRYDVAQKTDKLSNVENEFHFWPVKETWQEPAVNVGDQIQKKQIIAEGKTHIYFQANVWVFATLVIILGSIWGIGKAAVYKHIPDYFPNEVGVVGGMVGVLGGLGGFVCPIVFGYLLEATGLWSSCWILMIVLSVICLVWMHAVIQKMTDKAAPQIKENFETTSK